MLICWRCLIFLAIFVIVDIVIIDAAIPAFGQEVSQPREAEVLHGMKIVNEQLKGGGGGRAGGGGGRNEVVGDSVVQHHFLRNGRRLGAIGAVVVCIILVRFCPRAV